MRVAAIALMLLVEHCDEFYQEVRNNRHRRLAFGRDFWLLVVFDLNPL